jgi:hypothetical protein
LGQTDLLELVVFKSHRRSLLNMAQRSRRSRNFSVQQVLDEILGDSDSEVEEFSSSDDSVDEENA